MIPKGIQVFDGSGKSDDRPAHRDNVHFKRFEYTQGTSNKFWSIDLDGNSHTVIYGRIGNPGRTLTKKFTNKHEAKKSYLNLIGQKLVKGYEQI